MAKTGNTIRPLKLENCQQHKLYKEEPGDAERRLSPISESDNGFYELNVVTRYNSEIQDYERFYEVFNRETGVVEARLTGHFLSALGIMSGLDSLVRELKAGRRSLNRYAPTGYMLKNPHEDPEDGEGGGGNIH